MIGPVCGAVCVCNQASVLCCASHRHKARKKLTIDFRSEPRPELEPVKGLIDFLRPQLELFDD
jgi:hypothetical protein